MNLDIYNKDKDNSNKDIDIKNKIQYILHDYKKLSDDYQTKHEELDNIFNYLKEVIDTLINILQRDQSFYNDITKTLKDNPILNDRKELLDAQKKIMTEFVSLKDKLSPIVPITENDLNITDKYSADLNNHKGNNIMNNKSTYTEINKDDTTNINYNIDYENDNNYNIMNNKSTYTEINKDDTTNINYNIDYENDNNYNRLLEEINQINNNFKGREINNNLVNNIGKTLEKFLNTLKNKNPINDKSNNDDNSNVDNSNDDNSKDKSDDDNLNDDISNNDLNDDNSKDNISNTDNSDNDLNKDKNSLKNTSEDSSKNNCNYSFIKTNNNFPLIKGKRRLTKKK